MVNGVGETVYVDPLDDDNGRGAAGSGRIVK